ncbi:MAG TPA: cytochrome C oxidase subunit IV family protein [Acidimicrobiia bacterium]|nr:cytochrome C oxidase subunit IV family protein [Acidimicrobiia bacterium]
MTEGAHHPPHPTTGQYVKIAILLAIVTAVEVALFYVDEAVDMAGWDGPMLIILSFFKFVVVIGWFMHLRFEKPILTRFFAGGFILALGLYGIVIGSFLVGLITR